MDCAGGLMDLDNWVLAQLHHLLFLFFIAGGYKWRTLALSLSNEKTTCGAITYGTIYCWGSNETGVLTPERGFDKIITGGLTTPTPSYSNMIVACSVSPSSGCYATNIPKKVTTYYNGEILSVIGDLVVTSSGACYSSSSSDFLCRNQSQSAVNSLPGYPSSQSWSVLKYKEGSGCGITTAGSTYCWGAFSTYPTSTATPQWNYNGYSCASNWNDLSCRPPVITSATLYSEFANAKTIDVFAGVACSVLPDYTLQCVGSNSNGQFGDGSTSGSSSRAAGTTNWSGVSVGGSRNRSRG